LIVPLVIVCVIEWFCMVLRAAVSEGSIFSLIPWAKGAWILKRSVRDVWKFGRCLCDVHASLSTAASFMLSLWALGAEVMSDMALVVQG